MRLQRARMEVVRKDRRRRVSRTLKRRKRRAPAGRDLQFALAREVRKCFEQTGTAGLRALKRHKCRAPAASRGLGRIPHYWHASISLMVIAILTAKVQTLNMH